MATRGEYYWQKMAAKYPDDPQYEQFSERPVVHSDCCDVLIDDDSYNSEVCPKCDRSCELVEQREESKWKEGATVKVISGSYFTGQGGKIHEVTEDHIYVAIRSWYEPKIIPFSKNQLAIDD